MSSVDKETEEKTQVNRVGWFKAFFNSIPVSCEGYKDKDLERNARLSAIAWSVMTVVCMTVMLVVASRKTIVIAEASDDVAPVVTASQAVNNVDLAGNKYALAMQETDGNKESWELLGTLVIPVAKGIGATDVSIENHAITREIWIYLWGEDAAYPTENPLYGDISKVEYGIYEVMEEGVVLKLHMDRVYDLKSTMDGGRLTVSLNRPADKYDMIVVVDPDVEDDVAMAVSRLLLKSSAGDNIKIYSTRYGYEDATDAQIRLLIDDVKADIYLAIGTSQDDDPERYGIGCEYNDKYFIPNFGSLELADVITRNAVISSVNRAVAPVGFKDGLGLVLDIPAARINLGYRSNILENELMNSAEYQGKLAQGIVNGVQEVYSMIVEDAPQ